MPLRWPGSGSTPLRYLRLPRRAEPRGPDAARGAHPRAAVPAAQGLLALARASVVGWIFFGPVWQFLERPYCRIEIHARPAGRPVRLQACALFVTGIFDAFFLHLKIAVVVGILISSPVWLYQLWAFVAPGLYRASGAGPTRSSGTAVPLFALGGGVRLPGDDPRPAVPARPRAGRVAPPIITINTYLGYAMAMLLIFGLAFEVPLTLVILNLAGVLTHERFRKWRRMMIFGVFAFAGGRHAEPGSDHYAAARRALRGSGRARRDCHLANDRRRGTAALAV